MALIELRDVGTVFGRRPAQALAQARAGLAKAELLARGGHTLALRQVSLDIAAGEIFVVMGPSGSGKSTLVRHINRLIAPTAGSVRVDGREVTTMGRAELTRLRRQRLAMVFQHVGLLPHRRVDDNVAYGLALRGLPAAECKRRAAHWIERVGLSGFERHWPAQLSGGMRQRVGLARALAADTDILLMDEAFSSLDPLLRGQLQRELLALQQDLGKTIVFITHDLDEALRLGSRVAILRDGALLQVDMPAELLRRPADAEVAGFLREVNRARALRLSAALLPWPDGLALPDPGDAVDADAPVEQLLDRLIGRSAPLALRRGGVVVGQLDFARLRALLAPDRVDPAPPTVRGGEVV